MAPPTVAFFGATGGCALNALILTLKNGFYATALARTPSKLIKLLDSRGVGQDTIKSHLTIIEGNAKDVESTKKTLMSQKNGDVADIIISGLGGIPKLTWNPLRPVTLDNPTICADATRVILRALTELPQTKKPLLAVISSTGLSATCRDVPIAYLLLYHVFLAIPHADKKMMESILFDPASNHASTLDVVSVRPTLLTDGAKLGADRVRVGTDEKPAIGYTISREDIGDWVFRELVNADGRSKWAGEKVSLTY